MRNWDLVNKFLTYITMINFSIGVILSAFFYGYILTQFPGGLLAVKFGGKNLFGFGVFFTAAATLFIPVAARSSPGVLIALRVVTGFCEVRICTKKKIEQYILPCRKKHLGFLWNETEQD